MFEKPARELDAAALVELEAYSKRWWNLPFDTRPADRGAAEGAIRDAYRLAGLAEPEEIVWAASPVALERSRKDRWYELSPGESVLREVVQLPLERAMRVVGALPSPTYAALSRAFPFRSRRHPFTGAGRAIEDSVRQVRWRPQTFLRVLANPWGKLRAFMDFQSASRAPWDSHELLGCARDRLRQRRGQHRSGRGAQVPRRTAPAYRHAPAGRTPRVSHRPRRRRRSASRRCGRRSGRRRADRA